MVIVDTSVLIEYFNGRLTPGTGWLRRQRTFKRIGVTNLVFVEVLQGIRDEKTFLKTESALSRFAFFEIGARDLAVASARNYRFLRRQGITLRSTIDCLVATFCIEMGFELLHNDRDFDHFETLLNLRVLRPPPQPIS